MNTSGLFLLIGGSVLLLAVYVVRRFKAFLIFFTRGINRSVIFQTLQRHCELTKEELFELVGGPSAPEIFEREFSDLVNKKLIKLNKSKKYETHDRHVI